MFHKLITGYLFCQTLILLVLVIPVWKVSADDSDAIRQEMSLAVQEYRAGKVKESIDRLNRLVKENPKNVDVLQLRAQVYQNQKEFGKAVEDFTKLIEIRPEVSPYYHQRGVCYFNLGKFKESVEDFDTYIEKNPDQEAHHWQRGISHYYAKMYKEGRRQFEIHQTVNSQDVENSVWHFLCVARDESLEAARKGLIEIQKDSRIPMMKVHELFRGKATVEDVLAEAEKGAESIGEDRLKLQRFYAHLYLGLYYEAHGKEDLAKKHIHLAATKYSVNGYMGDVARVHDQVLKDQEKPEKADEKK